MKKLVITVLILVFIAAAALLAIRLWSKGQILDGPGMIRETEFTSLSWSESASYAEGCFSFWVSKQDNAYQISCRAWDESASNWVETEEKAISEDNAWEIQNWLDTHLGDPLSADEAEPEFFALDEASGTFAVVFKGGRQGEYCLPSGESRSELYNILLNTAE